MAGPATEADVASGRCAVHPESPSVAVCGRCGDYHCAACHKRIAGRALCARCRKLPGVDYLEDTRLRFWGKRDGFVWYFGLVGVVSQVVALPTYVRRPDAASIGSAILWLVASIAYFSLYRPARAGLLVVAVLSLLASGARLAVGTALVTPEQAAALGGPPGVALVTLGAGTLGLLIVLLAYRSPRNKLAFRIPLDERDLQRLYDSYVSNPIAQRAAAYGVLSIFVPAASLITLVMGIVALRRVDPRAWPPRGGRTPAVLGIAASALGISLWGLVLVSILVGR